MSSTLTEMKAYITEFIGKPQGNNSSESKIVQEDTVSGDAGNSFCGCAYKRTNALPAKTLRFSVNLFNDVH